MSNKIEQTKCIAVSTETHAVLVNHILKVDGKIGRFTEKAIKEKIEREQKKLK
ncbi:MAG: hypothetical protein JWO06_1761, partial [Bacteroidota bacterium]|nr:hypothetical protein [Bacteroidota bacterium]